MQGSDFAEYFEELPYFKTHFLGVFAFDQFPNLKYRQCYIGNTDISSGPGEHWIGILQTKHNTIEIFDSLGFNEKKKLLIQKRFENSKGIKYLDINQTQFQSNTSTSCGRFVIYYLVRRLFNLDLSFKQFLRLSFVKSVNQNEKIVEKYCKQLLRKNTF